VKREILDMKHPPFPASTP